MSNNLAQKMDQPQPELEYAQVELLEADGIVVSTPTARFFARQAVSCLVRPLPGDTVLLSRDMTGQAYVLSVLERPDGEQATTLQVQGDLNLEAAGQVSLTSAQDIRLTSGQEVGVAASRISMNAAEAEGFFEKTTLTSRFFDGRFERIRQVAQAVDSFFGRVVERMKTNHRKVEEAEDVQVGQARYLVDGTWTVHTRQTMHTSQGHVKIDAETVQLN
jgi:hypothetical protein